MMNENTLFMFEMYLENLKLYKVAYDEGFDLSGFKNVQLATDYSYGLNEPIEHFMNLASHIFEIIECFALFDNEDSEEKEYWLNLCDPELLVDEDSVALVILDSRLDNPITGPVAYSYRGGNEAKIYQIDSGVVVHYDESYGQIDFVDVFRTLLKSFKRSTKKEVMTNEMAI